MRGAHAAERGQALLIVLAFVAAFLLVIWAALTLASAAFLGSNSVRADTRNTYALDAGLAFAIQLESSKPKGTGCNDDLGKTVPLVYASGTITVTVNATADPGCKTNKPSYTIAVTTSASARKLGAQIARTNPGNKSEFALNWVAYQ